MTWIKSSHSASSDCVEVAFQRSTYCDTSACVEVSFRKSSRSAGNGACVEVAFHKSSYSADSANCVEVGGCDCGADVLVRDSKDPDGPRLALSTRAFDDFLTGVKAGQFDRP